MLGQSLSLRMEKSVKPLRPIVAEDGGAETEGGGRMVIFGMKFIMKHGTTVENQRSGATKIKIYDNQ